MFQYKIHLNSSYYIVIVFKKGSGGRVVERRTVNRGDGGSIPPTAVSKLSSPHICLCLSEETLKPVVPSVWCLCQGK